VQLTATQIKAEMEKTLRLLVPFAKIQRSNLSYPYIYDMIVYSCKNYPHLRV
jgi:hypothetical protein